MSCVPSRSMSRSEALQAHEAETPPRDAGSFSNPLSLWRKIVFPAASLTSVWCTYDLSPRGEEPSDRVAEPSRPEEDAPLPAGSRLRIRFPAEEDMFET